MKRASWVLRASSCGFATLLAACGSIESQHGAPGTMHLVVAQFATSAPGDLASLPPLTLEPLPDLQWQVVTLPHALERQVLPKPTRAAFAQQESVTSWYRLDAPVAGDNLESLYLPRWHTLGAIAIYADGMLVFSSLREGPFSAFNDPTLARLPKLEAGSTLHLVVRIDSVRSAGAALSSVWLGPTTTMRSLFDTRRLLQNRLPQITSSIFLVLGLFAFGFWVRRRHERTQLLFFVLSVLFYVRSLHYYIEDTWIPDGWLDWLTVNSLGWLIVVSWFFAYSLHPMRSRLVERLLVGAMTVASLISLPAGSNIVLFNPLASLIFATTSFCVAAFITFAAWRARTLECALLAGVLWINLALGVHDLLLQSWKTNVESFYMLPIGVFALFGLFLSTELRRYLGALSASEAAGAVLELRLADRERELRESYDRLRQVEQAQLLSDERQRLMREMHDGLGSALMSSLVAVERGQMQPGDIAQVLRECVDDLKLTIDSLEPVGDDLLVLLATLRYRLEPRLQAAGIELSWEVQAVPVLAWLNPGAALQILRMLQEILANVLKHAGARRVHVATGVDAAEVVITVADDGAGFDVTRLAAGRGLGNLRRRAAEIGGRVEVESGAHGTSVRIHLPIER